MRKKKNNNQNNNNKTCRKHMFKLLVLKLETEKEKRRMLQESQEKLHGRAFELSIDP